MSYISSQSSVLMLPKGSGSIFSKWCACPRGPLCNSISCLNGYVRHLPLLKDSLKAVPMMKKGNIPFGNANLAAIVLASVLMSWQNQYNLNHSTVPESTCMLLPDLQAIEQVMVKKHSQKLNAKGNSGTAQSKAKSNPKRKASGGLTGQVPKKGCSEKFCQHCKAQHLGLPLL